MCVSTNKYILFYIKNIFPERKHIFKETKYFHELLTHTHTHVYETIEGCLINSIVAYIFIYISMYMNERNK